LLVEKEVGHCREPRWLNLSPLFENVLQVGHQRPGSDGGVRCFDVFEHSPSLLLAIELDLQLCDQLKFLLKLVKSFRLYRIILELSFGGFELCQLVFRVFELTG
jgi:hypothetical protein